MKAFLQAIAVVVTLCTVAFLDSRGHERVVVVVLEGARLATLKDAAVGARLPRLTSLISTGGVGGDLRASHDARSTDAIVASIFGDGRELSAFGRTPAPTWARLAQRARSSVVIGVRGTQRTMQDGGGILLPGPDPARGFLGPNLGVTIHREPIERGDAPWPYSIVAAKLAEASVSLGEGEASAWIEVPTGAEAFGVTRVYAIDKSVLYLSPVYLSVLRPDAGREDVFVADDPSSVVTSSRVRDYLPRHVSDLANDRLSVGVTLARANRWDLLVYVERRIRIAEAIERGAVAGADPGATESHRSDAPSPNVVSAYVEAEESLAQLLAVAGPQSVTVVVGIHNEVSSDDTVGWYAVSSESSSDSWSRATVDELRSTIDYLLNLPSAGDAASPIAAVIAAHPTQRVSDSEMPGHTGRDVVPLSVSSLREFSVLPGDERGIETVESLP